MTRQITGCLLWKVPREGGRRRRLHPPGVHAFRGDHGWGGAGGARGRCAALKSTHVVSSGLQLKDRQEPQRVG